MGGDGRGIRPRIGRSAPRPRLPGPSVTPAYPKSASTVRGEIPGVTAGAIWAGFPEYVSKLPPSPLCSPEDHRWLLASGAAAMAASFLTRTLLKKGWNSATGEDPPLNPASVKTSWSEALTWTVAASVVAGISQLAARRAMAETLGGPVPTDQFD